MKVQRVEKHVLKQNNKYYDMVDEFCYLSKNLYNHANYIVRNEFVKNDKWIRYNDLDKMLKADSEYPDYRNMPTAQSAQQILRLLDKNWKSFFSAIKDWAKNKDKYFGRPKLPNYKKKEGRQILILTNQNIKLKDNIIHFPKTFKGFTLNAVCCNKKNFAELNQIRFLPKNNHIVVEIVYSIEISEQSDDNGKYCSIDIGIDNLATVTNNVELPAFVINGKGLKSINKYYNKQIAHYKEIAKRMNELEYTKRMNSISTKRNAKVNDYMHKASRYIVDFCRNNDIHTLVIGYNKNWKQKSNMSKNVNQSFVGLPTQRFIEMCQYKGQECGINVILSEESYTSGTSFLDNEEPIKENYNKDRRIYRGLFISNREIKINADVNGSYQIMKKVFPKAFADGIKGVALHPIRVNIA